MDPSLDAVTFDFWNTLVYEEAGSLRAGQLQAWTSILGEAGVEVDRERLERSFDASWDTYVRSCEENRQYPYERAAADILAAIGLDPAPDVRSSLVEAFPRSGEGAELHMADGIEACLRALDAGGVRLGIICDVGMSPSPVLRSHLERKGLLELFDHWSFSDEVGVYKPSPEIFENELAGLGVTEPSRAAHVGDRRRTDIAGALAIGMIAVRYLGVFDDDDLTQPEGDHVVKHHDELAGVLGLS